MSASDRLDEYRRTRDLDRTPEPSGGAADGPFFVLQERDATSHHYDFRVAIGGGLASWAVPKGPSTDPRERRLALPTEDHPLDYADFEGVIPEGQVGAGPVLVWDRGPVTNLRAGKDDDGADLETSRAEGRIEVRLDGKKLTGGYALVRISDEGGDEERWLLVKMDDDGADARRNPVSTEPESVISGRTLDEVREEES